MFSLCNKAAHWEKIHPMEAQSMCRAFPGQQYRDLGGRFWGSAESVTSFSLDQPFGYRVKDKGHGREKHPPLCPHSFSSVFRSFLSSCYFIKDTRKNDPARRASWLEHGGHWGESDNTSGDGIQLVCAAWDMEAFTLSVSLKMDRIALRRSLFVLFYQWGMERVAFWSLITWMERRQCLFPNNSERACVPLAFAFGKERSWMTIEYSRPCFMEIQESVLQRNRTNRMCVQTKRVFF